jgi:hypothetical protein
VIFIGHSVFLEGYSGPTVIPTFLVDYFGEEIQVIPDEHCIRDDADSHQVIVGQRNWTHAINLAWRAE